MGGGLHSSEGHFSFDLVILSAVLSSVSIFISSVSLNFPLFAQPSVTLFSAVIVNNIEMFIVLEEKTP